MRVNGKILIRNKDNCKQLFKISWPIFAETALFMLLGSIDVLMLGKYSDVAVGAVGVANQVIGMIILVFEIISTGTAIISSQYVGAGKEEKEKYRLFGTSILINLFVGLLCSAFLVMMSKQIVISMNLSKQMLSFGKVYIDIVGGTSFMLALEFTFSAILRSHGFTKISMYVTIVVNLINICINYVLIYGKVGFPQLGVTGAAIGTAVSRFVATLFLGYLLFNKIFSGFNISDLKIYKNELKLIFKIGIPSGGESISYNLAKLFCTYILTNIGVVAITTNSYANTITMYIYLFTVAIGQGNAILIGQLCGKKEFAKVKKMTFVALKMTLIVAMSLAVVFAIFGKNIFGIFTLEGKIINLGASVLLINLLLEPGRTVNLILINALRAAGDVKFPIVIGIFSQWIVGVAVSYLLAVVFKLGLQGMWLALAMDEWIRAISMYLRWRSNKWHTKILV